MITDSFDEESKPLFTLEAFYGEPRHLVDTCLILFSKEIQDMVLKQYDCKEIAFIGACNGRIPIYAFSPFGKPIAFYLSMIGSTGAAECMYEASWVTGATKFIMFGSAGSLNKEKTTGKYVVPTEAYRDEGMSYHYQKPSDYLTIKNANHLSSVFEELHVPYVKGRVWTTDAMLRETVNQVRKRKEEGCIAVEMELAGVEAVADYHGLELYDFLETGDVLMEEDYEVSGLAEANHSFRKFFLALEIAKRI